MDLDRPSFAPSFSAVQAQRPTAARVAPTTSAVPVCVIEIIGCLETCLPTRSGPHLTQRGMRVFLWLLQSLVRHVKQTFVCEADFCVKSRSVGSASLQSMLCIWAPVTLVTNRMRRAVGGDPQELVPGLSAWRLICSLHLGISIASSRK